MVNLSWVLEWSRQPRYRKNSKVLWWFPQGCSVKLGNASQRSEGRTWRYHNNNNHYIIIYHIILYTMCIILYYYWPWTNCYSTWNDVFPKLAFQSQISLARLCPWRQGKSLDYSQSKSKWGFRWSRRWEMANQVILKWWAQISTCTFWEETLSAPPFWWRVISKPPCWRNDFGHGTTAACRGGDISSIQDSK